MRDSPPSVRNGPEQTLAAPPGTLEALASSPVGHASPCNAPTRPTGRLPSPDAPIFPSQEPLTSLTNFQGQQFGFSYDALSRRTQLTRPNGVTTDYSYDALSRLLAVLHKLGAATIDGATYTVDPVGNRTAKTDPRNATTSNYTCDAIYQLTQVMQGANPTESYTYDAVGNRLSSLGVSPYTYVLHPANLDTQGLGF